MWPAGFFLLCLFCHFSFGFWKPKKQTSHDKTHPTENKQRRGRHTATKRGQPRPNDPPHDPRQADDWRLRQQRTKTTCRARPGRNTMTAISDRPAATNLRTNGEDNQDNIQLRWRGLQRDRPHEEPAGCKAANTTMYQQNCCRENDPTINRPHASRPTPNQPDMQGFKRGRRPTGGGHHGAPRPLTTIPTGTTQRRNSTIIQMTNQPQRTTSHPWPPERAQARPSQEA